MIKKLYQQADKTSVKIRKPVVNEFYLKQLQQQADNCWHKDKTGNEWLNECLRVPDK